MRLVVDSNVVFSALFNKGKSFEVFAANRLFKTFELVSTEFMFSEIGKRLDKLLSESKLTKEELSEVFSFIKNEINLISSSEFSDKLDEAKKLNEKDSPYLALALKLNCPILSGDKGLTGQKMVKILPPSEALKLIYGFEE